MDDHLLTKTCCSATPLDRYTTTHSVLLRHLTDILLLSLTNVTQQCIRILIALYSYGLLGPSGSGKTTLLKSVVGQLTPTEGWVKVFGFQPNQPGSQIPGSAIGYMPQELAVYEDFTIKETLWYFGRLYRIPKKVIKERIEFLLTFLDLPRSKRLIVNMSGGQKRRVSLASALVHSPPLLILDEPTVGVDPLLRQSIWQHLVTLTQTEKITVIVTTHYIEEARRANIVGLMRRGKLLAENAPEDLMAKHDSTSLEDVFLKLCVSDTMRRAHKFASLTGIPVQAITGTTSVIPTPEIESKRIHCSSVLVINNGGRAISDSGASQSPDEGSNNNLSNSGQSEVSDKQIMKRDHIMDSSPTNRSFNESEATTIEAGSVLNQPTGATGADLDERGSGDQANGGGEQAEKRFHSSKAADQRDQQPSKAARKFQIKSFFKFGSSSAVAEMKAAERRRQSGSHFIEQLMSKYQHEQQLGLANGRPIDQMLNCDTANNNSNKLSSARSQQQQAQRQTSDNGQVDQNHLSVPKIAVHGSYDDSGASSNGSSQNHSPVGRLNHHNQASDNNNLIASAYNNHSYQASECGSAYNDLALISSVNNGVNIQNHHHHHQNEHHHHQNINRTKTAFDDDLTDDVMLDPELFMNPAELSTMSPGRKYDYKTQSISEYCDTIGTISWKNYIRLKRNVPLLLFQFVLPAIQVILFCICVGNDPFDISVAVVNEESSADSVAALSTQFLRSIDTHLVKQVNFTDLEQAIESVKRGKNWGVIHIPENFTLSIHKRFAGIEGELDDVTLENSTIKVYPDMTNQPIGHAMEVAFRRAYKDLSRTTFEFLGLNPALSDPPIRMESAVYGKVDIQNYLQYMSPGVLISISYIMATGLTSLAFIMERRDGLYDRTLAAGVDQVQMLISHSIVQLVVMVVQISLVVFFTFVIYKVPTNGPFVWVFFLLLLQGLAGMSFGLMVSAICKEENTAIMMILGTFYPNLLLAGVIWPIEAIPHWLRWFSYLQPQTLPTQSLRDLIVRGWDIDQPGVWSGFAVTSIWLLLFLVISCIAFKVRK